MHIAVTVMITFMGLFAEDKPKPIPAEMASDLFWADAQVLRAQGILTEAQRQKDVAVTTLIKFCGDKAAPSVDPQNSKKLVCLPKPKGK